MKIMLMLFLLALLIFLGIAIWSLRRLKAEVIRPPGAQLISQELEHLPKKTPTPSIWTRYGKYMILLLILLIGCWVGYQALSNSRANTNTQFVDAKTKGENRASAYTEIELKLQQLIDGATEEEKVKLETIQVLFSNQFSTFKQILANANEIPENSEPEVVLAHMESLLDAIDRMDTFLDKTSETTPNLTLKEAIASVRKRMQDKDARIELLSDDNKNLLADRDEKEKLLKQYEQTIDEMQTKLAAGDTSAKAKLDSLRIEMAVIKSQLQEKDSIITALELEPARYFNARSLQIADIIISPKLVPAFTKNIDKEHKTITVDDTYPIDWVLPEFELSFIYNDSFDSALVKPKVYLTTATNNHDVFPTPDFPLKRNADNWRNVTCTFNIPDEHFLTGEYYATIEYNGEFAGKARVVLKR